MRKNSLTNKGKRNHIVQEVNCYKAYPGWRSNDGPSPQLLIKLIEIKCSSTDQTSNEGFDICMVFIW